MADRLVVFVHGWSVYETDTYGRLPERLAAEAPGLGLGIEIQHVYLGKYVSFRDEVRLEDISRAFEAAVRREPAIVAALDAGRRMVVITHSTGGPVVRDWWNRFYVAPKKAPPCPMSHLIMLAPANFGSALAQLGKSAIGRIVSEVQDGVEPGTGVLDWLELGSPESWELNKAWIGSKPPWKANPPVFPFVLTGQSIDRSLYDHVNSYTSENGSDGVVRVPSANLNATYVRLEQEADPAAGGKPVFTLATRLVAPRTAFGVLPGRSHSGDEMGIIRSVKDDGSPHPTVDAVLKCLSVADASRYQDVCKELDGLTARTQADEQPESRSELFLFERHFIHDRTTQLIVRLSDHRGFALGDFDFLLTACDPDHPDEGFRAPNPNLLPEGFFADRQRNSRHGSTLTYLLDYDVLVGAPPVVTKGGKQIRDVVRGVKAVGLRVVPRPQAPRASPEAAQAVVHYATAEFIGDAKALFEFVKPNQTLLLDIVMRRVVREGVFRLSPGTEGQAFPTQDFRNDPPGSPIQETRS